MIKWKRPSGSFIETGETDAIIKYAVDNGWTQADKPVDKPEVKKKAMKVKNDNSKADTRRCS